MKMIHSHIVRLHSLGIVEFSLLIFVLFYSQIWNKKVQISEISIKACPVSHKFLYNTDLDVKCPEAALGVGRGAMLEYGWNAWEPINPVCRMFFGR